MPTKKAYRPRKSPFDRVKELAAKRNKKNNKPLWDFDRDGVTYTILSRLRSCKERARLSYVEGWSETGLQAALEFGSAFHACLENPLSPPEKITKQYQEQRIKDKVLFPNQYMEFEVLMSLVEATVIAYRERYKQEDKKRNFILHEEAFSVQYPLTLQPYSFSNEYFTYKQGSVAAGMQNVRPVRLQGRWDGVFRDEKGKLWLFETKTKSDIDSEGINRTLSKDLQTMLYVVALELHLKEPVAGVVYNVIKRPQYRLGKKENLVTFSRRVRKLLLDNVRSSRENSNVFLRWTHTLQPGDKELWCKHTLDPLLTQVALWWDSIKGNPFNPWGSPFHNETPFGVYDPLGSGRRGDFFTLLTGGGTSGLTRREMASPELAN